MADASVIFRWNGSPGEAGWRATLVTGDSPVMTVEVGPTLSAEAGWFERVDCMQLSVDELEQHFRRDYPETTRRYTIEFVKQ